MLINDYFLDMFIIIFTMIEYFYFKFFTDEFSKRKTSEYIMFIELILSIIVISIMTIYKVNPSIKITISMILAFFFYKFNYDAKSSKCLFIVLSYFMMLMGFDTLSLYIVAITNHILDINKVLNNEILKTKCIFVSKSLLIIVIFIKKIINLKLHIEIKKKNYILFIPVLANIFSSSIILKLVLRNKNIGRMDIIELFTVSFVLLLSNVSLIYMSWKVIQTSKIELENKLIKNKMNMQYEYYMNLKESQKLTRILYHDMKNHIICMEGLYRFENNILKADINDKYIEEIKLQLEKCNYGFNTHNIILDVLLSEKKSICNKNNINFSVDINFSGTEFIEMQDVCSIFSNMIDNAIEACKKINYKDIKKSIKLKGKKVKNFLVIKCENPKINEVEFNQYNKINTDKDTPFLHGIGITSIKKSLEKYDGHMDIDISKYQFKIIIFIPLEK